MREAARRFPDKALAKVQRISRDKALEYNLFSPNTAAAVVEQRFSRAWTRADVTLTASRMR